ncbi:MAG: TonB-dependent siderophore receptor [Comamonadaceae bacterium]|nr:MAG: TonB-dependent siderophore receptor [Comamonadaceae bacterium]
MTRDLYNVEAVEVIKGPSGADIGRTAPSGYINLVSKVPQGNNFFAGSVSFGTGSQKRTTVDVNRVLNESGSMAFRLNAMLQDSGVPGRDEVKNKGWGLAPSIAFGLNTPTRVYVQYQHMNQRNRPDGGLPTVGLPGYYLAQLSAIGGNGPEVDRSNYYGYLSDHDKVDADMLTARVEHDFSPTTRLTNITRWGRSKQDLVLTAPFSNGLLTPSLGNPLSWQTRVLPQGKLQQNEVLTNQTNVTAELLTGGIKHTLTGGLEIAREEQENHTLAATINEFNGVRTVTNGAVSYLAYNSLYLPNPSRNLTPVLPTGARTDGKFSTIGAYLFDTIKFNEQWQLTGGLRYEHYRTRYTNLAAPGANGLQAVNAAQSVSDNLLTGKLGVVYKPAANGSIYAAYSTSATPPGSNFSFPASTTTANANNLNTDPQKAKTVEVGTKWDVLDKRLSLAGAVFRTTNKNEQAQLDPLTRESVVFGKTRVDGLELSAVGQITPAWQVIGSFTHLNSKILEGTAGNTGAVLRWTPKNSAALWTSYRFPIGLTVGGGVRYASTQLRSTSNAAITTTSFFPNVPSYTLWDAMVGYEVNKNVSIQLNLYNLSDKFYVARLNNAGNRYTMGTPRSAVLSANFRF